MIHVHNTRSRQHLHLQHTLPLGRDLSNLKEVIVYGILSHTNSSL